MQFLTDFADQAVVLPVAAAVALLLVAGGWWRGAAAWSVCVGGVLALMGALKVVFVACAAPLARFGIHSPSGHTAAAAVVYGGIGLLFARQHLPWPVLVVIPLVTTTAVGVSRLALRAHVPAEVLLGGAVGLVGAALLLPLAGQPPPLRRWPVAAAVIGLAIAFHGTRLQAEHMIHQLALLSWLPFAAMCRV